MEEDTIALYAHLIPSTTHDIRESLKIKCSPKATIKELYEKVLDHLHSKNVKNCLIDKTYRMEIRNTGF